MQLLFIPIRSFQVRRTSNKACVPNIEIEKITEIEVLPNVFFLCRTVYWYILFFSYLNYWWTIFRHKCQVFCQINSFITELLRSSYVMHTTKRFMNFLILFKEESAKHTFHFHFDLKQLSTFNLNLIGIRIFEYFKKNLWSTF